MGGRDISGEAPCGGTKAYRTLREEEEEEEGVVEGAGRRAGCKWMIFIINELNMRRQRRRRKRRGSSGRKGIRLSAGEPGYESD